jgi:hypothetical protein
MSEMLDVLLKIGHVRKETTQYCYQHVVIRIVEITYVRII